MFSGIIHAFDRITIYVDDRLSENVIKSRIGNDCNNVEVRHPIHKYHRIWATKIELFQPTPEALVELSRIVGVRNLTKISRAEIAIDWLTSNKGNATDIGRYLLEHMVVPWTRASVRIEDTTVYFNRRTSSNGKPSPKGTVFYVDRPSKLLAGRHPSACCHLEQRLADHASCSSIGLNTLDDCISFDHLRFWQSELRLRQFSSKADLGAALSIRAGLSGSAHRSRAMHFLKQHRAAPAYAPAYVLQSCVRAAPIIRRTLTRIDNKHLLATQMCT
ncbi:hypothetical protein [Pandoraea communis]|uniref:hypothetical protein n=1 Tax=Pandoraea communis TaxID=2508297 RepID=UPI0012418B21|nr:hypothetical protein [Pandoraea communis]